MDNRSREASRLVMVSNNGFSRRRHRSATSDGGGHVELPETVRLRDRMVKKDRDHDRDSVLSRSKRRRSSHSMHREEGEDSTGESVGNEQDFDDSGVSGRLSPHTASSISDHNHRRAVQSTRNGKQTQPPPPWKVSDETIGFPVPRKARSASGKRSHENWISAGGNGGRDEPQPSNSPARASLETISHSSSNVSVGKKVKKIGSKIQLSETGKPPSSTQEDIEIEIAGLLCDLMASKKNDSPLKSEPNDIDNDSKKERAEIACLVAYSPSTNRDSSGVPQITSACFYTSSDNAVKNNHSEGGGGPSILALQNSTDNEGMGQHVKQEAPSQESVKLSICPSQVPKLNSGFGNFDLDARSNRKQASETEKSPSNDGDRLSSVSPTKSKRVEKFVIDLMASPPMTSSPEQDSSLLGELTAESKPMTKEDLINVGDKMEKEVRNEVSVELEDEIDTGKGKREFLKLELGKSSREFATLSGEMKGTSWGKEQQNASSSDALKQTAQSSLAPFPVATAGWQTGLPPLGYMPPSYQAIAPVEISGSSISPTLQPTRFSFSQPRPKRCATHQFIARNISLHQQFAKTNQFWPAAVISTSVPVADPNIFHGLLPTQSVDSGRQVQRTLMGMDLDSGQVKGDATLTPGLAALKTLGSSHSEDSTKKKQLAVEPSLQPTSTCGLMRGPASLYLPSQHQATVANQPGPAKSNGSSSKSENSAAGPLAASSSMPATATLNFGYPNLGNDQAPCLAIIHNNGYPFSFQSPLGTVPAFKGESSTQTMPVINGSFYSSQMFHPSQLPQQQTRMQTLIQPTNHSISLSGKTSSSHKQQPGAKVSGNKILTPTSLQFQQPQMHASLSHQTLKAESEISGESTQSLVGRAAYSQNGFHGQSFTVQAQPLQFPLKVATSSGSNAMVNYNDKHQSQQQQRQHSQQKTHKGGVELMPSQPFAISFASFNGAGCAPSSLNFSSTAQSPVMFQSLSDVSQLGYHVAGVSSSSQQKHNLASEGKIASHSSQTDDEKKATPGKLSNSGPTTLVFDNSSRTLNFMSSSVVGSWPSNSITSTALATNAPLASNAACSQQPHVIQRQKHHVIQHQQHAMPGRSKISTVNTSSTGAGFPNNPLVFSQTSMQCNSSVPSSQGRSSGRASDSQTHLPSLVASTTTSPAQTSFVQQGRVLPRRTQISFCGNPHLEVLPAQMSLVVGSNQPSTSITEFSPNGCNSRPNPQNGKSGPLQMQQTDHPSAGTGQKSSPVCGRNLPSILSTCPSHISELKY